MPVALDLYAGGELRSETHFGVSDWVFSSDIALGADCARGDVVKSSRWMCVEVKRRG